ncbi:MAG: helix-turn-helix domain-containing protein [Chitinophagales bacterium]|nr:helix-turn-helix domain-containing protein [Chitinophagales bacterium]
MTKEKEVLNCIREVLEEQGRTQTWLTKKLGLAFGTVNAWCNNRSQPYLTDLIRTAELLEVAPADLIVDGTKKEKGLSRPQTFLKIT